MLSRINSMFVVKRAFKEKFLCSSGVGSGKKKKNKVGAFRARVNAHVKLAALRLHNSVASKNNTAVPATRSCRAQLERHSKDNSARGKKSRSRLASIIYACAALSH